ncbi:hypothetical protein [Candidatus Soleaferrea massiliensis]|uniref:hypothetical protein n=1 Tax=Candidatus Soleaferrea massiliensis TaxID=1470354 RepID=UPI003B967F1D
MKPNSTPAPGGMPHSAKERSFMKRSGLKALSIFTATAICMSVTLVPMAFAKETGGYEKDETVYLMLNADGSVRVQIVSSWLHNDHGIGSYTEQTSMKDVKNVKSDEAPTLSGNKLTWKLDGNDVYYEGTTDKTPPVSMKISYKLDGKKIEPQALAGKDGRVEITVSFQNHVKQTKTIDGKKRDIYTPFIVAAVCDLPTDHFQNVKVSSGKVLSEGNNQVITMISAPGLRESLGSGIDAVEELTGFELRDSFTITAEASAFEMEPIMGGILTDLPLDSLKEISSAGQLTDALTSMKDATGQLTDGTKALSDALRTYSGKMDELLSSVGILDSGALALDDGISTLAGGAGQLLGGIGTLQSGVQALHTGIGSLSGGAGQLTLGAQKLRLGSADLKTGAEGLTGGITGLYSGLSELDSGAKDLQSGARQVDDGAKSLAGGIGKLNTGAKDLNTGSRDLYTGLAQLNTGAKDLKDGIEAYTKAIGDALGGIQQKLPEIENSMNAFGQDMTGSLTDIQTDLEQSSSEMQGIMAQIAALETQIDTMRQTLGEDAVKPLQDTVNTLKQQLAGHASTLQATGGDVQKLAGTAQNFQKDFGKTYEELKQKLAPLSEQLPAQSQKLLNGAKQVSGGVSGLLDGAKKLSAGTSSLYQGTEDAQKGAGTLQNGTAQVYSGAQGLAAGSAQALSGAAQLQAGSRKVAGGASDLNVGANELFGGLSTLSDGVGQISGGADSLLAGVRTFSEKSAPLSAGIDQLLSGAHSLKAGTAALTSGVSQLDAASGTLSEKSGELDDGMQTFKKQAVDQLDEKVAPKLDDLNDILAVKDELINAGESYTSFAGAADGCESTVKFIIKADGIKPAQQVSADVPEQTQPQNENFWDKIVNFFKGLFGIE